MVSRYLHIAFIVFAVLAMAKKKPSSKKGAKKAKQKSPTSNASSNPATSSYVDIGMQTHCDVCVNMIEAWYSGYTHFCDRDSQESGEVVRLLYYILPSVPFKPGKPCLCR